MSDSMKDAFQKTAKGKKLYFEAKQRELAKVKRIRQLKSLVHDTFVANVPEGRSKRWDVYQRSKETVKKIAIKGGKPYEQTMLALKFAWTSRKNYKLAVEAIGC